VFGADFYAFHAFAGMATSPQRDFIRRRDVAAMIWLI